MAKDELIDNYVSLRQCEKAVKALHSHQTKKLEERQESELIPKEEYIWLNVAVKRVSPTLNVKPVRIPVAHPIVDPRTTPVCLICKDPQRQYKDLLEAHKIKFISRVVGLEKLKGKFKPFEARRMLLKENGLFLADDRVIPLLPKLLGSKWFKAKKQPIPVSLTKKDLKKELERAICSTYMNQNTGTCTSVRVGSIAQKPSQIIENLKTALPAIVRHIKDGWDNVQCFYIKTNSSVSLPVWTCPLGDGKEGRWDGLTAEVQNEEGVAEGEEIEPVAPPSTRAKHQTDTPKSKGKKRESEEGQEGDKDKPKKKAKKAQEQGHDGDKPKKKKEEDPCKDEQKKSKKSEHVSPAPSSQLVPIEPRTEPNKNKDDPPGQKSEEPLTSEKSQKMERSQKTKPSKEVISTESSNGTETAKRATATVTKADLKQKRVKNADEKKKERLLSSKGGRSVKATITGRKAARD